MTTNHVTIAPETGVSTSSHGTQASHGNQGGSHSLSGYGSGAVRPTKPKRRLNAYNFFFKMERERLLKVLPTPDCHTSRKGHGKISFKALARTVSANWKVASQDYKDFCLELAQRDKLRFEREMQVYREATAASATTASDATTASSVAATTGVVRGSTASATKASTATMRMPPSSTRQHGHMHPGDPSAVVSEEESSQSTEDQFYYHPPATAPPPPPRHQHRQQEHHPYSWDVHHAHAFPDYFQSPVGQPCEYGHEYGLPYPDYHHLPAEHVTSPSQQPKGRQDEENLSHVQPYHDPWVGISELTEKLDTDCQDLLLRSFLD